MQMHQPEPAARGHCPKVLQKVKKSVTVRNAVSTDGWPGTTKERGQLLFAF